MRKGRQRSVPLMVLWLLLILFIARGFVTALIFPAFSGHDEVAHYAYLRVLAEEGRVPIIPDPDTWRLDYAREGNALAWDRMPAELYRYAHKSGQVTTYTTPDWYGGERVPVWAVSYDGKTYPSGWIYTGNHPPLFYTLMIPVYHLVKSLDVDQQLFVFRLATLPFGLATIVLAYLTVRTLFPRDQFLATVVPAFVAFQPQISYESVMLNNDILAIALTSAIVWMLVVGLRHRFPLWNAMAIGVLLGLALLAKSTSVIVVAPIAIAMIFGIGVRQWKRWLGLGTVTAAIAAVLAAPWYIHMWAQYGDFTALSRVEELQWWNYASGSRPTIWEMLRNRWFHWDRLKETWGAFGWRRIQLDMWGHSALLQVILWLSIIAFAGLAVYAIRFLRVQRSLMRREEAGEVFLEAARDYDNTLAIQSWQGTGVLVMGAACIVGYAAVVQFGTTFVLTQARYYFPMIVPAAILFMLGIRSWFPPRWLPFVAAVSFLGMIMLNVIIYTAYVIPFWAQFQVPLLLP